MADTAEFPYRIAVGWVTIATIEGSLAYLLTAFPAQSDQFSTNLFPWGPPVDDLTTWPESLRYGQYETQEQWDDGGKKFQWGLKFLTEQMQYYWENLLFGAIANNVQSTQVTVKHRRAADSAGFAVYQGYANRAIPNKGYKRGTRGVLDYVQPFVGMNEIFA